MDWDQEEKVDFSNSNWHHQVLESFCSGGCGGITTADTFHPATKSCVDGGFQDTGCSCEGTS